jgi:hypothetical protein
MTSVGDVVIGCPEGLNVSSLGGQVESAPMETDLYAARGSPSGLDLAERAGSYRRLRILPEVLNAEVIREAPQVLSGFVVRAAYIRCSAFPDDHLDFHTNGFWEVRSLVRNVLPGRMLIERKAIDSVFELTLR